MIKIKLKSLGYTMDIVGTSRSTPSIFINPIMRRNLKSNKETGHRRFYMNEKGLKKFQEFILEQWKNNLNEK